MGILLRGRNVAVCLFMAYGVARGSADVLVEPAACDTTALQAAQTQLSSCTNHRAQLESDMKAWMAKAEEERSSCTTKVSDLLQQSESTQTELKQAHAGLEAQFAAERQNLEQQIALLQKQVQQAEARKESSDASHLEVIQNLKTQVLDTRKEAQEALTSANRAMHKMQKEVEQFTRTVYSSSHFRSSLNHLKRLTTAFFQFLQKRLEDSIGVDVITLSRLQLAVWKARIAQTTEPAYLKAKSFTIHQYNRQAPNLQFAVGLWQKVLSTVEGSMERVIRNLSTVDPDIRSVFPDNFHDRCYAFAFILTIAYVVVGVIQSVLQTMFKPIQALLPGAKSKSVKKSGNKFATRQQEKPVIVRQAKAKTGAEAVPDGNSKP